MKTLLSIIFACVLTSIFSCQKPLTENEPFHRLSLSTQQAMNGNSVEEIKQRYELLTSDEKQILWETKWSSIIENDGGYLLPEQIKIIIQIRDFCRMNTVDKLLRHPEIGNNFLNTNLKHFEKNFSNQQLFFLLEFPFFCKNFSILKTNQYINRLPSLERPNGNCTCYYSISCYLDNYTVCIDGECNRVTGCGLLGSSNCSGTCN